LRSYFFKFEKMTWCTCFRCSKILDQLELLRVCASVHPVEKLVEVEGM